MTILFNSAAPVNPAARTFGKGLLRSRPVYRADFSAEDAAWLQADNARRAELDRELDQMAAESDALDRMERGCYSV